MACAPDSQHSSGWAFCSGILPAVSRSFALIIPRCPPPLDRALCIGYLLCRIADTIEDEDSLTELQRQPLYRTFLAAVDAPERVDLATAFVKSWPALPAGDYGRLVEHTGEVLEAYRGLPAETLLPLRQCVHEMVEGMARCRPAEVIGGVRFLCRDLHDLDAYCHIVAGTVGIMSTALFGWHFGPGFKVPAEWREDGRRMGLGLQMTNIIKDCRVDAERGVSFVPAGFVGLQEGYRLTDQGRSVLIRHTIGHLDRAMAYTQAIPAGQNGVRTFLLGSLLPAIATLEAAADGTQYQPKITRADMGEIFALIDAPEDGFEAVRAWYQQRCERTLGRTALS